MERNATKRILSFTLALILCLAPVLTMQAADEVTPTNKEYNVDFYEADGMFLSNKEPVNLTEGEEVYLTYTVDSVEKDDSTQQGLVVTRQSNTEYPYNQRGWYQYVGKSVLFKEGYTYFFKFDVTEDGFEHVSAYAKGEENQYISFPSYTGEIMTDMKYAGIFFAYGGVTAKLSHVRCYDKNGNDLGLAMNHMNEGAVYIKEHMTGLKNIQHSYEFELEDAYNVAISNERYSKADVVYMEYRVETASDNTNQSGLEMTNSPKSTIPHGGNNAFLRYSNYLKEGEKGLLCIPGATYLIRFERTAEDFQGTVKYTVNGKTKYHVFPSVWGAFQSDYGYFTIWFGDGKQHTLDAKFVDFKCYDENGNNLAVQTNQGVEIIHHGGLEDYSACEAVYYCLKNDTFITLDDEKNASMHVDGAEETIKGTYFIDGSSMLLNIGDQSTEYVYFYRHLTDTDGNRYIRMKDNKVKFVTGTEEKIEVASAENSFKVIKPQDPTLKNNTFKGWCLGDGTEYDFEQVVTKATTLYAKWVDGDGNEYLATETAGNRINTTPIIVISVCALLVIGTTVIGILLMRGGRKRGNK